MAVAAKEASVSMGMGYVLRTYSYGRIEVCKGAR